MKIIKDGVELVDLPRKPRNYDGGRNGSTIYVMLGDEKIILAKYDTPERASQVCNDMANAYIKDDADIFVLPAQ